MYSTDFLFAKPGFFGGMAATLDIGSTLTIYNESASPEEADAKAMESDWGVVGQDILAAMSGFEQAHGKK
ncbi:MAG: hypothetical protein ACOYJV_01575 [Aminivibrio sp.]|jgi:hypothetical protein